MRLRALFAALILLAAVPAAGQGSPPPETEELINYPYAVGDTAFFNVVGQSVQLVRLPISYTVRSAEERGWGAKLRFPVSVGLHEFSASGTVGGQLRENLATVSGLAGVEFDLPVGKHWRLAPYAEFGAGKDLDGGELAWIYSAGLAAVKEVQVRRVLYRPGGALSYDGASLSGGGPSTGYTTLELGLDARIPMRRTIGGRASDWSLYAIRRRFLDTLTFDQLDGTPAELRDQNEIGFTIGVERPFRLWLLEVDRIGLGARFGDQLTSIRILFGVPF